MPYQVSNGAYEKKSPYNLMVVYVGFFLKYLSFKDKGLT